MTFGIRVVEKASLFSKTALLSILTLTVGLGLAVWPITNQGKAADRNALEDVLSFAHTEAVLVAQDFDNVFGIVRTLRDTLVSMKRAGIVDRKAYFEAVRQDASFCPERSGIWTVWEPNALDGHDEQYVHTAGHDATGRFVPNFWKDANGGLTQDTVVGYDRPEEGEYYFLAREQMAEQVLEPYPHFVANREVWFTSLVVPIIIDGNVVGVVGLDLPLDLLLDKLNKRLDHIKSFKTFKTESVSLVSSKGAWVMHALPQNIGKPILDDSSQLEEIVHKIASGKVFFYSVNSAALKTKTIWLFAPVSVSKTGTPWALMVDLQAAGIALPEK